MPAGGLVQIQTKSLKLKDDLVAKTKLSLQVVDKLDPPANRIVPPLPGSVGDPTLAGGAVTCLQLGRPDHRSGHLRAGGGGLEALGSSTNPKGYKYNGKMVGDTVIKSVTVKADSIRVKGAGTYTLDEPAQGRMAVRASRSGARRGAPTRRRR